jgi:hypothetical protein
MTKRKTARKPELSFAQKEVKKINAILDGNSLDRQCWASDRIGWLYKFHKAPKAILDALCDKATAIFDGTWYGDEPCETTIKNFIEGV